MEEPHNLAEVPFHTHQERLQWQKRFVDFVNKHKDHECAILGAMGFSTAYIAYKTKLSESQVQYRLSKAQISRMDIRNGDSPFAQALVKQARSAIDDRLTAHLRKHAVTTAGLNNLQAAAGNREAVA